jgi:hypothetical protein
MDFYEPPGGESVSRWLSLLIVLGYVTVAGAMEGMLAAFKVALGMTLPLLCIWFPDVSGEHTGGRITGPSPASLVWFLGWLVLLLPALISAFLWFQGVPVDNWL